MRTRFDKKILRQILNYAAKKFYDIVDRGQEVETVRIGDRLTFKIEIPDKTPYGIFARSCVAMAKVSSPPLWFVHTRNVDLAILLCDVISIETLPSFQIATAGDSDNM